MKLKLTLSTRTALGILVAVALVGGGVMIERFSRGTGNVASSAPRYKSTVRIINESAGIGDALERIKESQSSEILQSVVRSLDLANRWNADEAAACGRLQMMIEAHVESDAPEVLIVAVRSADELEPEEIAGALAKILVHHGTTKAQGQEADEEAGGKWEAEYKHQISVLEKARLKMMEVMKRTKTVDRLPLSTAQMTQPQIDAIEQLLALVKSDRQHPDQSSGNSVPGNVSTSGAENTIAGLELLISAELTPGDLKTLKSIGASDRTESASEDDRAHLEHSLELLLLRSRELLSVNKPGLDKEYLNAKKEYETQFQTLNALRRLAPPKPGMENAR